MDYSNEQYENIRYTDRLAEQKSQMKLEKRKKVVKIVAAAAIVMTISGGINYALAQAQSHTPEQDAEIVQIVEVPFNSDYDLVVLSNNDAYYQDSQGKQVDVINGVSATEFASNIGLINTDSKENHVR